MATLAAFKFDTPDGAEQALDSVLAMQKQKAVLPSRAMGSWRSFSALR